MVRIRLVRFAALLACCSSLGARADLLFPSVAAGQRFDALFTLATTTGSPLAGVPVSLAVPDGCGQVSPSQVTTDSSGKGAFQFTAGGRPGVCAITGSSNGVTARGQTTIFRPEELHFDGITFIDAWFEQHWDTSYFSINATAGGLPLPLLPMQVGDFPAGGPAVTSARQTSTDSSGAARVDVRFNTQAGIYDVPVAVGGVTRHLRVRQGPMPRTSVSTAYEAWVQGSNQPAHVTLVDGAAGGCAFGGAARYGPTPPPAGTSEFFNELIELRMNCTTSSTRIRIEYPDPIPQDAQPYTYGFAPGIGPRFMPLAAAIAGNVLTATVGNFDATGSGDFSAKVGLALPGTWPPADPPRVQDLWWGGVSENGWGVAIAQAPSPGSTLFAAIYAYDAGGNPTWWVMSLGTWSTSRGARFSAPAYAPLGSPWFAYEPGILYVGDAAGKVTFSFDAAGKGTMDFTLNGLTGRKSIQRQLFGAPSSSSRPDVGGIWWGGQAQNGWGISVVQQYDKLFSVWYTYDSTNKPTWYVMPDGDWSNATTYSGRVYRTRGSPWLTGTYDPSRLTVTDVGSYTFTFSTDPLAIYTYTRGVFTYSIEGRSGSIPIAKQPPYY